MKRTLSFLGLLLALAVFSAGAKTVYFGTDDPDATYLGISEPYGMTPVEWEPDGTATVELTDTQGVNVCLNRGYLSEGIYVDEKRVCATFTGTFFLTPEMLPDGCQVEIRTAQTEQTTVVVEGDPSQISVSYLYHTYSAGEWTGGRLRIPIVDKTENVTIAAGQGYGLESVVYNGNDVLSGSLTTYTVNSQSLPGGDCVYKVESFILADARTSFFSVDLTGDPSEVELTLAGDPSTVITGEALASPIAFNPGFDLPVTVTHVPFAESMYKVEANGLEIPATDYIYRIYSLKDGGTIKIEVDFPDIEIPIRLNFVNPDTENAVKYVFGGGGLIISPEIWKAPGWTIPMGDQVTLALNYDDFIVSASCNGIDVDMDYIHIIALDEAGYDVEIVAEPREPYAVTFNYEGLPARFRVLIGAFGDDYAEMTGEDSTTVSVPRTKARVRIVPDEGWAVKQVYADGKPSDSDIPVTGDMQVDVYMEEDQSLSPEIYSARSASPTDVYSLQGIRIIKDATPERIGQLPAGIYIISGRKVTVK